MRERTEQVLRLTCLVLGALLLFQIGRIVIHRNPVAHLQIPALPTLAEADKKGDQTNGPAAQTHADGTATHPEAGHLAKSTNAAVGPLASKSGTNASLEAASEKSGTNMPASNVEPQTAAVRTNPSIETQAPQENLAGSPAEADLGSNHVAKAHLPSTPQTNDIEANASSNGVSGKPNSNTTHTALAKSSTNSLSHSSNGPPPAVLAGMPGGPRGPGMRPGMPGKAPEVPPEILARVDRVTDSEILGPIMHPLPMALLGIAGNVAFLRAPTGQTGLVKEGDKLGELKLLKIGINRVLVEEDGQKKELMIFSGLGGDSLLPNEHKSSP